MKLTIWETALEKLVESKSDNENEIPDLRSNIKGDIVSILEDQVNCFEKLYTSERWESDSAA